MRNLMLAAIYATLATLAALITPAVLPAPALAQEVAIANTSPKLPGGLSFGHASFTGEVRPGLSANWNAGRNTTFTLGAGASPAVDPAPASVSGSIGLTIRF